MFKAVRQNAVMMGKDTLSAPLAECYITINGRRYNFMQAIKLEAQFGESRKREQGEWMGRDRLCHVPFQHIRIPQNDAGLQRYRERHLF